MRSRNGRSKNRTYGLVAQLGERRVRNAEVEGSIPFESTKSLEIMRFQDFFINLIHYQ